MSASCSRMSQNALLFILLAKFLGLAATFSPSLLLGSDRRFAGWARAPTPWARCRNVRGVRGMTVRLRASNSNETTSSRAGDDVEGVGDGKVGKGTGEKKFLFSRRLFNFFDKDKDGKVSVSEVASILGVCSLSSFASPRLLWHAGMEKKNAQAPEFRANCCTPL